MAIDLINDAIFYEQEIDYSPGPKAKRLAVVVKRFTTKAGFRVRVRDDEGNEFNLECPSWLYHKARLGTKVELVYQLIKGEPDEYREKLLGIKRLSPSGNRCISWAV
ncbi:hypothetical protein IJG93_00525 [Candidatus Saccharibacteria bacterium]|nr:hypothetical protein [Candidatus Saccharibacteria bacterium]